LLNKKIKVMSNKLKFTVEILMALTFASLEDETATIDAIAEQFHTETEPALKKTLGAKYSEFAKEYNKKVGRKVFFETIQTAEKNGTPRNPKGVEKAADTNTAGEGAKTDAPAEPKMIDHVVTQEDLDANAQLVTDGVKVGDTIQIPDASAPAPVIEAAAKPAANRVKITDEIVEEVIQGIREGQKPKDIAARKLKPETEGGEPRSMNITADNVYDIFHLRGRFGQKVEWVAAVTQAKKDGEEARKAAAEEAKKIADAAKAAAKNTTAPAENAAGTTAPTAAATAPETAATAPAAETPAPAATVENAVETGAASAEGNTDTTGATETEQGGF
jgi:hypothetical protein